MRHLIKRIIHPFFKKAGAYYHSRPRKYSYDGIQIFVHPEVFPPHLTLSTKIILDFISSMDLEQKTFLELGCGSGIVSLYARKKGALVTASDINQKALDYLKKESEKNELDIEIVYSDLFSNLTNPNFDYTIINPPYYPKDPESIEQNAWFCGENFEYFTRLFEQLNVHRHSLGSVLMILSEDCQIDHIKGLAAQNNLCLNEIYQTKKAFELNYIFSIENMA